MMRFAALLSLCSLLVAYDATFDLVAYEVSGRFTTQINYMPMVHGDFRLGELKDSWDTADRYELDIIYLHPLNKHVEAFGGAYAFWENREYNKGSAYIDYDILGFGWEGGTIWYPLPNGSMSPVNLGIMPYGRIGYGSQDAAFNGIPYDPNFADGYINRGRWEFAVGIDARLSLARHIQVTLGTGVQAWASDQTPAALVDDSGNVIEQLNPLSFRGDDAWVRIGFGFQF